jgi:hypothetical protein
MAHLTSHPYARRGWTAILIILATRLAAVMLWNAFPPLSASVTYALIFCDLILLIWQIRYGAKVAKDTNGSSLAWIIWGVIPFIAAVTLSNAANKVAALHVRPPPIPVATPALEVIDGSAIFTGEIDFVGFAALENTLEVDNTIETLQISSNGGRIAAARGMARLVAENGLATRAVGTCASACTLVFIAGSPRTLAPEARLGFHGYKLRSEIATLDTNAEQRRDQETFASRGVSQDFLSRAFAVQHHEMWFPTRADLAHAGVLTDER